MYAHIDVHGCTSINPQLLPSCPWSAAPVPWWALSEHNAHATSAIFTVHQTRNQTIFTGVCTPNNDWSLYYKFQDVC